MVTGLGGIGKSAVAADYALQMKEVYVGGVFRFNAESWPSLHISVRENVSLKPNAIITSCMLTVVCFVAH